MSDLHARFGSARHPERAVAHQRPAATDDATVDAVGKISAAFEVVENARGMLYAFHRMSGEADLAQGEPGELRVQERDLRRLEHEAGGALKVPAPGGGVGVHARGIETERPGAEAHRGGKRRHGRRQRAIRVV